MNRDYWHRQTSDRPLFPELLWSRPESKMHAGKLLIIGGNAHGFAAPAEAYQQALQAGAGAARVLLPDSLRKTVGKVFAAGEFAPSTPSGSFARKALAEFLDQGNWADGVLLAGDFGRNSETAIVLDTFIEHYGGHVTLTQDAVDYFAKAPQKLLARPQTTLVLSLAQLQEIARFAAFPTAVTFGMDLLRLVEALHEFTQRFAVNIIVKHLRYLCVAAAGQVSSTTLTADLEIWRVRTATSASIWWLQNPTQTFAALSTSLIAEPTG